MAPNRILSRCRAQAAIPDDERGPIVAAIVASEWASLRGYASGRLRCSTSTLSTWLGKRTASGMPAGAFSMLRRDFPDVDLSWLPVRTR